MFYKSIQGIEYMLEWLMVPALIGVAALVPIGNNDKQKIKRIFEATGYGVPDKERKKLMTPQFRKKLPIMDQDEQIGIRYLYKIPLGLPATKAAEMEKSVGFFTDGLNRPVIVEFRRVLDKDPRKYLTVSVFNKDIPSLFPYKQIPCQKPLNEGEKNEYMEWLVPLGRTLEDVVFHDFDKIPHKTVAGTTRFGKTVFLKVLMTYLIENHPNDVEFHIIDLKGGLEFSKYKKLRQVKTVATNAFEAFALLKRLTNQFPDENEGEDYGEIEYVFEEFRKKGISNIVHTSIKKRTFIIVDEGAQMTPGTFMSSKEKNMLIECQSKLSRIAAVSGALGYRLVFATQYPVATTLPREIKQNADGKITFRLPTGYASEVAIDEYGAEKLPSDIKGRMLYKTHELREMQAPLIEDDEMWERLAKYQEPQIMEGEAENVIEYREGSPSTGTDTIIIE
jgi:DNA segregation ATPase FtsK/SpoIIIE, S-DNA-T family